MNADGQGNPMGVPRPMTPADTEMTGMDGDGDRMQQSHDGEAVQQSVAPQPPQNNEQNNDPENQQG